MVKTSKTRSGQNDEAETTTKSTKPKVQVTCDKTSKAIEKECQKTGFAKNHETHKKDTKIPNTNKNLTLFSLDDFFEADFAHPTSRSSINESSCLLSRKTPSATFQKVDLSTENSLWNSGKVSFRVLETPRNDQTKNLFHRRAINLKSVNTFANLTNNHDCTEDVDEAKLISPYIVAYRHKIKKWRSPQKQEITIPPRMIELNQSQTTFCSCKTSQCLKLYCECFKSLGICGPNCKCEGCQNNTDNFQTRLSALNKTLTSTYGKNCYRPLSESFVNMKDSNPDFQKIDFSNLKKQEIFCRCKKSNCTNNYCSCHVGGKKCGPSCHCLECNNKV